MLTCSVKEVFRNPEKYIDRPVKIAGWTRTVRSSKSFGFIELNDGSFFRSLQVVFEEGVIDNFDEVSRMPSGSSIEAFGEIVKSPGARQLFELKAYKIIINGISSPDYPLQKKRHSFEFLRTIPHLRARTNTFSAVFRVRSILSHAIHSFFQERGFVYVHTPIITSNDAEGAGEMFRVTTLDLLNLPRDSKGNIDFSKDFFGRETNLTVSGQLAVESYCMAFGKVYTFGPTFRAENSNTARHSSEFWMIEPEIAFADIRDNMELAEDLIKYVIDRLLESAPEEMQFFNTHIDNSLFGRLDNVLNSSFEVISYTEAVELLKKENHGFQFPADWGNDLQTEHERFLTEKVFKKPVFVIDYPKDIKAFYMRVNDDETKLGIYVRELGFTGYEMESRLRREYNIQIELSDLYNILAIVSIGDRKEDLEALINALKDISQKSTKIGFPDAVPFLENPKMIVSPRDAFYSPKKSIPLEEAEGEIAGEMIMAYPPGIPVICMGERITRDVIDYIKVLKEQKCELQGTADPYIENVRVLGV
jgi:asparaginyl-tRNA synthetase